jgi:hypothetical protein
MAFAIGWEPKGACKTYSGFVTSREFRQSNPNVRIAVVTTDASILDLPDLYTAPGHSPYPLRIFPALAEASTWLAG